MTLKRNQAYVMKYVMQDYNKLAHVMDQPREHRELILTSQGDKAELKYLISLVDLLATCAEVSNISIIIVIMGLKSVSASEDVIGDPCRLGTNSGELLEPRREEREKVLKERASSVLARQEKHSL